MTTTSNNYIIKVRRGAVMKIEKGILKDVKPRDIVDGTFSSWKGVKEIGEFAFRSCTSLKRITIPSTIERIGKYAFSFTGLEEVVILKGDIVLENGIFENCRPPNRQTESLVWLRGGWQMCELSVSLNES